MIKFLLDKYKLMLNNLKYRIGIKMRITEIINNNYCYAATIRATHGETEMAKKIIRANSIREARALLTAM